MPKTQKPLVKPKKIKRPWGVKKTKSQKQAKIALHSIYGYQKVHDTNLAAYKQDKYALVVEQKQKKINALESKKKLSVLNRLLWRKTRAKRGFRKSNTKKKKYNAAAELAISKLYGVTNLEPKLNNEGKPIEQPRTLSETLNALKTKYQENKEAELMEKRQPLMEAIQQKKEINDAVITTHAKRENAEQALKDAKKSGTKMDILTAKTTLAKAQEEYEEAKERYKSDEYKDIKTKIKTETETLKETMKEDRIGSISINNLKLVSKGTKEGKAIKRTARLNNKMNLVETLKSAKHSSRKKLSKFKSSKNQEQLTKNEILGANTEKIVKDKIASGKKISRSERKILKKGRRAKAILNTLEKNKMLIVNNTKRPVRATKPSYAQNISLKLKKQEEPNIKTKYTADEIEKLTEEMDEHNKELDKLEPSLRPIKDNLGTYSYNLTRTNLEIRTINGKLESLNKQKPSPQITEEVLNNIKAKENLDNQKIDLETKINSINIFPDMVKYNMILEQVKQIQDIIKESKQNTNDNSNV